MFRPTRAADGYHVQQPATAHTHRAPPHSCATCGTMYRQYGMWRMAAGNIPTTFRCTSSLGVRASRRSCLPNQPTSQSATHPRAVFPLLTPCCFHAHLNNLLDLWYVVHQHVLNSTLEGDSRRGAATAGTLGEVGRTAGSTCNRTHAGGSVFMTPVHACRSEWIHACVHAAVSSLAKVDCGILAMPSAVCSLSVCLPARVDTRVVFVQQ